MKHLMQYLNLSIFLGRRFSLSSIIFSSSFVTSDNGRFFGMYCRSKPLMFLLLPLCQLAKGSAKYPVELSSASIR